MRIAIAGGTGFVGKALTNKLLELGHEIFVLTRDDQNRDNRNNMTYVQWLTDGSDPARRLQHIDVIINLAGESINSGRWTNNRKNRIQKSRLEATDEMISTIKQLEGKPRVLINASAIGYYGTSLTDTFTEKTNEVGKDFLATTVGLWEERASQATEPGIRTVLCRFGIILDKKEGALPRMVLPYKWYAGGTVGSGEQWMSWIHLDDVVDAILFIIENEAISGPVNFTSPYPIRMEELGKAIGKALNRPHWMPAPAFALKIALGEMSLLVLEGQRVLPEKLQKFGYSFQYKQIHEALNRIYRV